MTVREGAPDHYPLEILGSILGGLWSSRLDRTVVQQDRVAAGVGAWNIALRRGGYFNVSASVAPGHDVTEAEKAVWREIRRVQDEGVTADELERAKVQVEAGRVSRLESNLGLAFWIADAVGVSGDLGYMTEQERLVLAVTTADVHSVARKYLQPGQSCVVELRNTPGAVKSEAGADTSHGNRTGTPPRQRALGRLCGGDENSQGGSPNRIQNP